jgi:hypothetical protein
MHFKLAVERYEKVIMNSGGILCRIRKGTLSDPAPTNVSILKSDKTWKTGKERTWKVEM